ncbi:uncharacterized protein LOC130737403 [Lotus japonicus]|uniref:uncharacterized protein LOC130737403 n=1 Tax=Lotus japonicus TaxID=34305 RepID=UPI00258AC9CA|nr:uncharacterized protein LOC130737403 [Lotus japonicus]
MQQPAPFPQSTIPIGKNQYTQDTITQLNQIQTQTGSMEVAVAVPPPPPPLPDFNFNFDSNCSSPYTTAPSSPRRFTNFFFSAPASPTHSLFLHSAATTTTNHHAADADENFEFDFSGDFGRPPSLSADELFHGGKIRPLSETAKKSASKKEPNRIVQKEQRTSSKRVEIIQIRSSSFSLPSSPPRSSSSNHHIGSGRRSASAVSESHNVFHQIESTNNNSNNSNNSITNTTTTTTTESETAASTFSSFLQSISFAKGYRKWRLKDFLLFRSASEGRATDKDPLRKYAIAQQQHEDGVSGSSFRSTESSGSVSRRRGPVSAHELHYTLNRAASVEMRKKTMLPYKQGLLGCLGFNQGTRQISGRFGSFDRS